jgi:hypothetical protein
MLKLALMAAILGAGAAADASSRCAGETYTRTVVTVTINTVGAVGFPQSGQVSIRPATGAARSYNLDSNEIVQYYESDANRRAIVGLGAYEQTNYPVLARYVGTNYQGDLVRVLRDPNRRRQSGNEMRVWMGPGYPWDRQFRFIDVVCSVVIDP